MFFYNPNPKLYIGCNQSWKNVPYTVVSGWVLTDGEITKLSARNWEEAKKIVEKK